MPVHLLFGIRDDALHRLDQLRAFIPGILNTTIELGGLNDAGIREAIVGPVTRYNENYRTEASAIRIEDGLVATLIGQLKETDNQVAGRRRAQDVKRRIELPYLQLALMKIWEAEGGNAATALREATLVTRLGGVGRIVRDHVNSVMGTLDAPANKRFAPKCLIVWSPPSVAKSPIQLPHWRLPTSLAQT